MAYTKQGFQDNVWDEDGKLVQRGTTLRAQHLINIEEALQDLDDRAVKQTDETLSFENGVLSVKTAKEVEADNTLPITAAAVHTTVGNIEILLSTI